MFEKFTESARRSIFFARNEASQLGSPYIETGHLLLGLLRESPLLKSRLTEDAVDDIRARVGAKQGGDIALALDLPLSRACKQVLNLAMEESDELGDRVIDCGHLLLGLMRLTPPDPLTEVLASHGIAYPGIRAVVRSSKTAAESGFRLRSLLDRVAERERESDDDSPQAAAPEMQETVDALHLLIHRLAQHADLYSPNYGARRLKRKPWTRMEAMGHLIDYGTAHHQWIVRALAEPMLTGAAQPGEDWVRIEAYRDYSWPAIIDAWVALNRLLVHVLSRIPATKLETPCRIGVAGPVSLFRLAGAYVAHCDDIVGQVLALL